MGIITNKKTGNEVFVNIEEILADARKQRELENGELVTTVQEPTEITYYDSVNKEWVSFMRS